MTTYSSAPLPLRTSQIATHPHHAVAVRQPAALQGRGSCHREAVRESHLRRVHIAVREPREGHLSRGGRIEFRFDFADAGRQRMAVLGVSPLHDVVVLDSNDRQGVEIPCAGQCFDVGDVQRRKAGRHFNDHPPGGDFDIQGVVQIERPPIRRTSTPPKLPPYWHAWRPAPPPTKKSACTALKF